MIKYTKSTMEILNFIKDYGFITSKICANIFFKNSKFPKEQARRKLKLLMENKDIVGNRMGFNKEFIYQLQKCDISDYEYYLLNLISKFYKLSNEVEFISVDNVLNCNMFIVIKSYLNGNLYRRSFLIDFEKFNDIKISKYDLLYESKEVQEYFKNNHDIETFPDIIIVNYNGNVSFKPKYNFSINGIDYDSNGLKELLLGT